MAAIETRPTERPVPLANACSSCTASHHERTFAVKHPGEQMFALRLPARYRSTNARSPPRGPALGGQPGTETGGDQNGGGMAQVLSTKRKEILDCIVRVGPRTAATPRRCARSARWSGSPLPRPCTPTWPCCSARVTCGVTRPNRGPSRSATTRRPRSSSSRARCATCRWSVRWRPAPACWPRRTSKSSCRYRRTSPARARSSCCECAATR